MRVQPFVALVGALQVAGAIYSAARGDWRMALINLGVGVANAALSTMGK